MEIQHITAVECSMVSWEERGRDRVVILDLQAVSRRRTIKPENGVETIRHSNSGHELGDLEKHCGELGKREITHTHCYLSR